MFIDNLNPILFQFGFITIRWYGVFLACGILTCFFIYQKLWQEKKYNLDLLYDLLIWLIIGGLIGARLGHIIFYNLTFFLNNPWEIIFINHGGLSSHGLTIGLLLTLYFFVKKKKINIQKYIDILILPIPLLAFFIRIGNFFNSEIIGKASELPWCVYFPKNNLELVCRHPSQLYEALITLTIFFICLYTYKKIKYRPYFILNLFLLLYFSTRFLVEFVKERHILFDFPLSMGQILSIPFIIYSVYWFFKKRVNK
ncbi:MAG: prolipoprotein diacylglyceryl transferase [Patescibacteria group bacterium]